MPDQSNPSASNPWRDAAKFRKKLRLQALRSFLRLAGGIGIVAFLLPLTLILIEGYGVHLSISHYYYSANPLGRNVLVGALCAVGVFLFLFQGLSKWENLLLKIAGVSVITVALVPMSECQVNCGKSVSVHGLAAGVFFFCLSLVAIFFSKSRLGEIVWLPLRKRLEWAYNLCGAAMAVIPNMLFLCHLFGDPSAASPLIFWAESAGVWAFSSYWFFKFYEYRKLTGAG